MDSLSQLTLGAAVGEAVLGRKLGNWAIVWGGLAGTIPDLDVFLMPLIQDPVVELGFHRGYSHAFFFQFFLALAMARLWTYFYRNNTREVRFMDWFWLWFLGFTTHAILDSFTTYGTQLFLPFSDYRAGINNIFVADPLYTLPFLLFSIAAMFFSRNHRTRRILNYTGITVSCLYLLFTFSNKIRMNQVVRETLAEQGIAYEKYLTAPTPLQNILWYTVVDAGDGYYMGVYSFLDNKRHIDFEYFDKQNHLLEGIHQTRAVQAIIWFSKGYYLPRQTERGLFIYDIKFGKMDVTNQNGATDHRFVFPFRVFQEENGTWTFEQVFERPDGARMREGLRSLFQRLKGK
jgi:inner membrane protein